MQALKPKPKFGWHGQVTTTDPTDQTENPCGNIWITDEGDKIRLGSRVYHVNAPGYLGTITDGPTPKAIGTGFLYWVFEVTWDNHFHTLGPCDHRCHTLRKVKP